ncbi:MAG: family 10 glycosylhydrolase [Thermoclostridium sp.]|nr:family 10 glycosylhydrolase [Thermoclostridium sp.]
MYIRKILLSVLVITLAIGLPSYANQAMPSPAPASQQAAPSPASASEQVISSPADGNPELTSLPTAENQEPAIPSEYQSLEAFSLPTPNDIRGVWVATAANTDYPLKPTTSAEALKQEAISILNNIESLGLNTVFLQVRPAADAIYPSEYFPWSRFLTGSEGTSPDQSFDPLAFWIDEAHKRNIQLHAWLTPFRVTKKAYEEPDQNFSALSPSSPAYQHQNWVVKHSDGNLYFNPGIPEVRQLIVDSTMEIVKNYAVDGIHFDGFFYPDKVFQDQDTFKQYAKNGESIGNWRRSNINALLREVHEAVHACERDLRFGVSPFGIWANQPDSPLGSATSGQESYHQQYADSLCWIQQGLVDYIAPQVFWNIGYPAADYKVLVSWWKNAVSNSGVELYIGHAAYKAGSKDLKSAWYGTSEIEKQLNYNQNHPQIKGSVFYSYRSIADNSTLGQAIRSIYQMRDTPPTNIPVSFSRPLENLRTSYSKFYLNGASDPNQPLYLNGEPVKNRSIQGYFGVLVSVAYGDNTFTVTQGSSSDTRIIHRIQPEPSKPMQSAEIPQSSAYPQNKEYRAPGEKITLSCKAPVGSTVTVELNGKKYTMAAGKSSYKTGLYAVTYTYTYTLPTYTGSPRVIDLGAPVYKMSYKGTTKTRKAPASIGVIMAGAPYYAQVTADTFTYRAPDTDGGGYYELYSGMTDYVTGLTGGFARLSNGQYILKRTVEITSEMPNKPVTKTIEYIPGEKWDTLKLKTDGSPAAYISSDNKALCIHIPGSSSAKLPVLPETSLFSSIALTSKGYFSVYTLTLKNSRHLEGFIVEKTEDGLEINFKRRVYIAKGDKPLSGIRIMVDPGHGGAETGAIGPLGLKYSEKDMNLDNGFRLKDELEALGATVLMTRTADVDLSLAERLVASKQARPDMFISIHSNAMPDNVDMTEYFGFSTYHREAHSRSLSQIILDHTIATLGRKNRGIHQKNFYVVKGTWAPSMLFECGFVPNPVEFEWLTDEASQKALMKTIAQAIVKYFSE